MLVILKAKVIIIFEYCIKMHKKRLMNQFISLLLSIKKGITSLL